MGTKFDTLTTVGLLAGEHRYDEVRHFYRPDVRGWSPSYEFEGVDAWVDLLRAQNDPFSDIVTEQQLVAETDTSVVTEWTWTATHTGAIDAGGFELPATGKCVTLRGMAVFEFADDKVAGFRQYWDSAGFAAQFA
jgi:steroid delta-isomerase-like uncharacterized protein